MDSFQDTAAALPGRGRLIGIDYGTKRVGVSVSDLFQRIASPLNNYQRNGVQADERYFRGLVEEYEVAGFVVGLPVHLSGDESPKSREAREYARWLSNITGIPHAFQDERHSSSMAEAMMLQVGMTRKQRNARIDKLAAHILLQAYLDSRSESGSTLADQQN